MPGAKFDLLTPVDVFDQVGVPREGTFITAVREDPDDGPVRPAYQNLTNQTWWLRRGVVEGMRTVARLHAARGGGAAPSMATLGSIVADANGTIGGDLQVGGDAKVGSSVTAGLSVIAGILVQAGLFLRAGLSGGPNIIITGDALSFLNVGLGGANPAPGDDSVRNKCHASTLTKQWGNVVIEAGKITRYKGFGGFEPKLVNFGGATPEPIRLQVNFLLGVLYKSSEDYGVTWGAYAKEGTFSGGIGGRVIRKMIPAFEIVLFDDAKKLIDLMAATTTMEISFHVDGVYFT